MNMSSHSHSLRGLPNDFHATIKISFFGATAGLGFQFLLTIGSLGDPDDSNNNPYKKDLNVDDLSDTETQISTVSFPPESLSGGEFTDEDIDELQILHGPVPLDDTLHVEDDFETQVMSLGDERQVVNLGGETQMLDYLDGVENNGTQLLYDDCDTEVVVDTNDEGSGRTEILCDSDEVSDDSTVKKRVDQENMLHTASQKNAGGQFQVQKRALSNEDCSSGSKGTDSGSCSIMSESQSLKQHSAEHDASPVLRVSLKYVEEIDQGNTTGEYVDKMKGLSNENKCRVGRSAVRKLFTEDDAPAEIKGFDDILNDELAGLSYVDSQEPIESSQANELDFVDRVLKVNVAEF